MPGGHSGLTYRLETSEGPLVVKSVPEGQKAIGRHDMLRQARIIVGARAQRACRCPPSSPPTTPSRRGSPCSWSEGESLEPVLDDPEVPADLAAARMLRAAEILPALHDVPLDKVPVDGPPLSPLDELGRWARTMAAVPPELVPDADRLHARLAAVVPDAVAPTLVHGDYRLGNLICNGIEPAALIDWEIWSVGDPRVELGWFLVFADGANFPGVGREVAGLPTPTSSSRRTPLTADRSTTSPGSTPWAATRWPRSWATTCAATSRVATTTPTRNACPTPSSRLIETGLSIAP